MNGHRKIELLVSGFSTALAAVVDQASRECLRGILEKMPLKSKATAKSTASKALGPRTNGRCDLCGTTRAHLRDCPTRTERAVIEAKKSASPTLAVQKDRSPTSKKEITQYVALGPRTDGRCDYCGSTRAHRKDCRIRTGRETPVAIDQPQTKTDDTPPTVIDATVAPASPETTSEATTVSPEVTVPVPVATPAVVPACKIGKPSKERRLAMIARIAQRSQMAAQLSETLSELDVLIASDEDTDLAVSETEGTDPI